jgi:hypothetical protein
MVVRRRIAVTGVALIATTTLACGSAVGHRRHSEASDLRQRVTTALARESSTQRKALLCVRLADEGAAEVQLVARKGRSLGRLNGLLRKSHIKLKSEDKTIGAYNEKIAALASQLRRLTPHRLAGVSVSHEVYGGKLVCPRAFIEVGPVGHPIPGAVVWAREMVARYGGGYVGYKAYGTLHLD